MLRLFRGNWRGFTRNRLRRDMEFDGKLKDFSQTEEVKLQMEEMRESFEIGGKEMFSDIMQKEKPKLGKRFSVDNRKLSKSIRKAYKEQITMENLTPHDGEDLDYLAAGNSKLLDQRAEVEFEEEFAKQLFRGRETQRLLSRIGSNVKNHLAGQQDAQFQKYEDAKMKLKNNRISNMMNSSRNNEQLQLLLQSGLMNNPSNLRALIDGALPNAHPNLLEAANSPETGAVVKREDLQARGVKEMTDLGPQEMQDHGKVMEFLGRYAEMSEEDQVKCKEDLSLLQLIKEYEERVFMSRYEGINFRFKGRVSFDWFEEKELMSYIKNEEMSPRELLSMFEQSQGKLSRFNRPILTPAVVSCIYSRTSLYQFPESEKNNRINMLHDPHFVKLEKLTFQNLQQLHDDDFCSALWSYSKNHQEEQGILNVRVSSKANDAAFEELSFRIYNMTEPNLGLALRAFCLLPVVKKGGKDWTNIVEYLADRLPTIETPYCMESIFSFLLCLPPTQGILPAISSNLPRYRDYPWTEPNTLATFMYASGYLIKMACLTRDPSLVAPIQQILVAKAAELEKNSLPQLSINHMPQFLTILRESEAALALPRLVNLTKKLTIENIRQQKEIVQTNELPKLVSSLALVDVQKYLHSKRSKISPAALEPSADFMSKLVLRLLLPFQAIPYNSANYLVYHELARFISTEMMNIPSKELANIMESLSLVKYKNEKFYDELAASILQSIGADPEPPQVRQLGAIINSYALQRRRNGVYEDTVDKFLGSLPQLLALPSNYLLRVLVGITSLSSQNPQLQSPIVEIIKKVFLPLLHAQGLSQEEKHSVLFVCAMLGHPHLVPDSLVPTSDSSVVVRQSDPVQCRLSQLIKSLARLMGGQEDGSLQAQLGRAERKFAQEFDLEMKSNEQKIGSALGYDLVYERLRDKLLQSHGKEDVVMKKWRIEVRSSKSVYFVATYDHLMALVGEERESVAVGLFGVWKLYEKLYKQKGWKFNLVCSFLEGR